MSTDAEMYLCIGICMADPDSGYCLGCGRPPLPVSNTSQGIVAEQHLPLSVPLELADTDTPVR
jgi:hypothetical protein